jgi:hypothetical protein
MNSPAVCVDPEQEHCTFSCRITGGMKSINSFPSNEKNSSVQLQQCKERITFLLHQIESLEHYLPETYQMLMDELDQQNVELKHLEIQDFYYRQINAEQDTTTDSGNQEQSQKHRHHPAGVPQ